MKIVDANDIKNGTNGGVPLLTIRHVTMVTQHHPKILLTLDFNKMSDEFNTFEILILSPFFSSEITTTHICNMSQVTSKVS